MKKIVLKVDLHDLKDKRKAMKAVASILGVDSIAMDMKDNKMTVTGDADPVEIAIKLRKLYHTDIVTVGPAEEPKKEEAKKEEPKKEEAKKEEEKKEGPNGYYDPYHHHVNVLTMEEYPNPCVIC